MELVSIFFTCKWVVTSKELFKCFFWIPVVDIFSEPGPTSAKLRWNPTL